MKKKERKLLKQIPNICIIQMRVDSQKKKSSQVSMKVKRQTRAAMMKQRQDAAAKLQALARGRRVRAQQKQHSSLSG